MKNLRTRLVYPAAAGALYAVLTMALAPLSYGAIQCRFSEILCILPFFLPETALGLALGCAAANTLSAAGLPDIVFGSLATLGAGLCTAALGRSFRESGRRPSLLRRAAACLMPVLWNGAVVGCVLARTLADPSAFRESALLFGSQVAAGEALVMLCAALPLMGTFRRLTARLPR